MASTGLRTVQKLWIWLQPSYFASSTKVTKQHPTSWLDGVRGLAAFFVFIDHATGQFILGIHHGWTFDDPQFLRLPLIRLVMAGPEMVDIFFVVSGYALSYKAINLAKKEDLDHLYPALTSSTFRRAARLYLPCAGVTLIEAILNYYHIYNDPYGEVTRQDSLFSQMSLWFNDVFTAMDITNIAGMGKPFHFEPHMWTIPFEFRGSIYVFVTLLALAKAKHSARLGCLLLLQCWLFYVGHWDFALFNGGIVICELQSKSSSTSRVLGPLTNMSVSSDPEKGFSSFKNRIPRNIKVFGQILFLCIILFILSVPQDAEGMGDIPLYNTINSYRPYNWEHNTETPSRPHSVISALAFVWFTGQTGFLQRFFRTSFIQYLGKISYSLYLIHRMVLIMFSHSIFNNLRPLFPSDNFTWDQICFGISMTIVCPLLFWLSDLGTRWIDEPSMDAARWMEKKVFNA